MLNLREREEAIKILEEIVELKSTPIFNSNSNTFYSSYNYNDEDIDIIKDKVMHNIESNYDAEMYDFVQHRGSKYKIPNSLFFSSDKRSEEFDKLFKEYLEDLEPNEDEHKFDSFEDFLDIFEDYLFSDLEDFDSIEELIKYKIETN